MLDLTMKWYKRLIHQCWKHVSLKVLFLTSLCGHFRGRTFWRRCVEVLKVSMTLNDKIPTCLIWRRPLSHCTWTQHLSSSSRAAPPWAPDWQVICPIGGSHYLAPPTFSLTMAFVQMCFFPSSSWRRSGEGHSTISFVEFFSLTFFTLFYFAV